MRLILEEFFFVTYEQFDWLLFVGIDVTYDVHHNGASSSGGQFKQGFGTGMGAGVHCGVFNNDVRKAEDAQAAAENKDAEQGAEKQQTPSAPEPATTQMETEDDAKGGEAPVSGQPQNVSFYMLLNCLFAEKQSIIL